MSYFTNIAVQNVNKGFVQTGEIIFKSRTAGDIQLLEVKTLIDKSLFWGLSTFYFLIQNYFSTCVFQEK
jgi:hypothetical protein